MKVELYRGVSLLEIMLVIVLMGTLLSLALPLWQSILARNRVGVTLYTVAAILRFASGIAAAQGRVVSVCALRTDRLKEIHGCQRGSQGWAAGVLVFSPQMGKALDHYEAGHSLRHVLFDPHVRVTSPQFAFRILAQGVPAMAHTFRIADRAERACATVTLTADGHIAICRGRRCIGCS